MLTPSLRSLVSTAVEHARLTDDGDHTVAAALLTASGEIVFGLNAFHFLGGPCAEVTALANHAATSAGPIVASVAVFGPSGEVIPPCGRCRQILHDRDPDMACVVRTAAGLEAFRVRELLPHAFDQRALDAVQRISMWEGYESVIRSGAKRQTIRVDDPFRVGPAVIAFDKSDGTTSTLPAQVTDVQATRRDLLTREQAVLDGFSSLDELQSALDTHYPGLPANAPVDVVTFDLAEGGTAEA